MATFYLLPPRSLLADHLVASVEGHFPGLEWDVAARRQLVERFVEALPLGEETFVVFREDLPEAAGVREQVEEALADGYGAETGDEILEVRPGCPARRWCVGATGSLAR